MEEDATSTYKRMTFNVGSRNSQLALIQTNTIISQLRNYYENNPDMLKDLNEGHECSIDFNVISMTTSGDQILDKALSDIGTKSLFTRELEIALLEGRVDFVVHSLKDLPTTLPEGCAIGSISKRDDPDDTIVLKKSLRDEMEPFDLIFGKNKGLKDDGSKHKIGTSSQRRIAMLRRCNNMLECINIRGNLNTRLGKLDKDDGEYSAIVLAKAGLDRMGWSDRASNTLSPSCDSRLTDWCYAVGQGAIAVECRLNDNLILNLLKPIVDLKTTYEAVSERSLMRRLEGGCSVPLGVRSTWTDSSLKEIRLSAIVLSIDGEKFVKAEGISELSNETDPQPDTGKTLNLMTTTTGIALSNQWTDTKVLYNLIECSRLGVNVANKMIDSGCLELIRLVK